MTLPNFDWTDKKSVRWFIMLPTGHEGPYSLDMLEERSAKKKLALSVSVWSEGLTNPLSLQEVLDLGSMSSLPPLPDEALPPEIPFQNIDEDLPQVPQRKLSPMLMLSLAAIGLMIFGVYMWLDAHEKFSIRRHPKMSMELHQRIQNEVSFEGWGKPIFFKEYVPADLSMIWLVTSSFQHCQVEATFHSVKDKLLALQDEKISFRGHGKLRDHVVEFSSYEFLTGNKIVPGMYEMDVKATHCEWDGLTAKMANGFSSPEAGYIARMKVILFAKGPAEFNRILDKLIRKKMELEVKNQNQSELFWQDLQEKFQTLLAITLQIEQLLLDLLDKDPKKVQQEIKPTIDQYTMKFGHFLTNFVVANESYFHGLQSHDPRINSSKGDYEMMVRVTSKNIGFESMKIIEDLQKLKNPKKPVIESLKQRVKKTYSAQKDEINRRIIRISEDRSH